MLRVSGVVEKPERSSDRVTEWPSDQVIEWPSDRVTKWPSDHQRPRNWRQVRQAEPIFLTKQPQGNQLGTDQATQIQDVDNKGR